MINYKLFFPIAIVFLTFLSHRSLVKFVNSNLLELKSSLLKFSLSNVTQQFQQTLNKNGVSHFVIPNQHVFCYTKLAFPFLDSQIGSCLF